MPMKRELGPSWSAEEEEAAERLRQAWEDYFSAADASAPGPPEPGSTFAEQAGLAQARARHESELMRYPNVVGVSEGVRMRGGRPTGEASLVVYVERKIPRDQLGEDELLPRQVDGVPVDVVEVGVIEPLPVPPKKGKR
jgi:hypothetical protein